jgi:hypothetical protein
MPGGAGLKRPRPKVGCSATEKEAGGGGDKEHAKLNAHKPGCSNRKCYKRPTKITWLIT